MPADYIVVVDTDIFSALYITPELAERRGRPVAVWRAALVGARVVISFQTKAEVLAGIRGSSWGESRTTSAMLELDRFPTIPADRSVVDAFATLSAACRRAGHALHDKIHTADRWVAASAVAKQLPLIARDGIYVGAPGLTLWEGATNV
ncbi:PIN domain-containing protein [uncultured Jatrophihabitans sp.]|uniref:PIN domain-containing protein n=1 Tax=uncultured Jatrophihabitans sp. TaxID=1610747 RepID=UPI0035CB7698